MWYLIHLGPHKCPLLVRCLTLATHSCGPSLIPLSLGPSQVPFTHAAQHSLLALLVVESWDLLRWQEVPAGYLQALELAS